jgi:hypothetical protein
MRYDDARTRRYAQVNDSIPANETPRYWRCLNCGQVCFDAPRRICALFAAILPHGNLARSIKRDPAHQNAAPHSAVCSMTEQSQRIRVMMGARWYSGGSKEDMARSLEDATIRMYEDISLTEELTDEPAKVLLKWGEAKLMTLAEKTTDIDSEDFEDHFKSLRRVMKSINKLAGQTGLDDDTVRTRLTKLIERAQSLGLPASEDRIEVYMQQRQSVSDDQAKVKLLTTLLEPDEADEPAPPDPPVVAEDRNPPGTEPERPNFLYDGTVRSWGHEHHLDSDDEDPKVE